MREERNRGQEALEGERKGERERENNKVGRIELQQVGVKKSPSYNEVLLCCFGWMDIKLD